MSQENPTSEQKQKSKESRNKLLLGSLVLTLAGLMYYQFFTDGDEPNRSSKVALKIASSPTPQRRTSGTPERIISQPLDIDLIHEENHASGGTGRNIFVYPTPTPLPPPPPVKPTPAPTPWPIPVFSVNPPGVIARTSAFTLTVLGEKIPQDAQGIINGRSYPTTFVSASQVKIEVPADTIKTVGSLGVMLRSEKNAELISNTISLRITAPPEPPYRYIGLYSVKNVPTAVLSQGGNEEDYHRVKKGDTVGGKWKILNITPQRVEIEDISIKVSHTINYSIDK